MMLWLSHFVEDEELVNNMLFNKFQFVGLIKMYAKCMQHVRESAECYNEINKLEFTEIDYGYTGNNK